MNPIDYILLGALACTLVGVAVHLIVRKKAGKGGCGCGCAGCPSAGSCPSGPKAKEEKDEKTV